MKHHTALIVAFFGLSLFGTIRPLLRSQIILDTATLASMEWPSQFMGEELYEVSLTEAEEAFYRDFPGEAAQFQVGADRLILRRVDQATRKLHPATDCFKGMGFSIEETGLRNDAYERISRTFTASKKGESFRVFELITDESGNTWSDVSSWYWAALMKQSEGPWTSYVRIQKTE